MYEEVVFDFPLRCSIRGAVQGKQALRKCESLAPLILEQQRLEHQFGQEKHGDPKKEVDVFSWEGLCMYKGSCRRFSFGLGGAAALINKPRNGATMPVVRSSGTLSLRTQAVGQVA